MDEVYKRLNDDTEFEEHITDPSEIQEFFAGETIFLTGSTGYVGKVLVEKLLRSCTDLNKIYFLVRSKKDPSAQRMKKYFNDPLFDRLKQEVPNCHEKIALIEGDLSKEDMGLSSEDRRKVIEETTLIYHNASNVKFDEKISVSIRVNVLGTNYMLALAKECRKLKAFMYVSTAYTHSYMHHIDDKFYPPPVSMDEIHELLALDEISPRGIEEKALEMVRGQWPNNYAFTKSVAESLVEKCGKEVSFPCSVYRPSVIISTNEEPIRGWCGNLNGPVGMIVGCGVGFIHALPPGLYPIDFTPIDMCVNALITATWDAVTNRDTDEGPRVYNYGSSVERPVNMRQFVDKVAYRGADVGTTKMMGGYYVIYTRCVYQFWFLHIVVQLFPALLADLFLLLSGNKPQVFAFWKLLTKNIHSLEFYVNGNWRIHVPRMRKIWQRLNKRDAKLFNSDLSKLNWDDYTYAYWHGIRHYILKDPLETAAAGRRLFNRLIFIQRTIYYLGQAIILYFVFRWIFPSFFGSFF